jgi:DNA-binding LytR/AlgR family response regulator
MKEIENKYLEGLVFNDVKPQLSQDKTKITYEKITRKLKPSDVLSFRETENEVIFVTADGKKYVRDRIKG